MPFPLSPQCLDAIAEIISGGSANDRNPSIGIYRKSHEIEKFMRACKVDFKVHGSRVPSLVECLIDLNNSYDGDQILSRIIEAAVDPRDFRNDQERHINVVNYLNDALHFDGFEIQKQGTGMKLVETGKGTPVLQALSGVSEAISFDTVSRDLDRALASIQNDPEDAVTAACSTIESVCRSILLELGEPLPDKKDIQSLYNAVKKPLNLSEGRSDLNPLIENDVRQVLSGLSNVIKGVGALRTHGGDAHGREKGYARIDSRIARLSIYSASAAALFLIETWQKHFPTKSLNRHSDKK